MDVRIVDYKKELENGKESYVSFGVETKVSLKRCIERERGGDRWRWIGRSELQRFFLLAQRS